MAKVVTKPADRTSFKVYTDQLMNRKTSYGVDDSTGVVEFEIGVLIANGLYFLLGAIIGAKTNIASGALPHAK